MLNCSSRKGYDELRQPLLMAARSLQTASKLTGSINLLQRSVVPRIINPVQRCFNARMATLANFQVPKVNNEPNVGHSDQIHI